MKNLFYFFNLFFLKILLTKKLLSFLLLSFLLLPQYACNTTEPPPNEVQPKSVKLKLLDVSCSEAFINVNASDAVLPVTISLKRDNTSIANFTLTKTDSIVVDTTLQPNITYTYQTTEQIKGKEENSDTIQVKTLNITSHNFSWQIFTFGNPQVGGSCNLYDVTIINENDIWAVGEIYVDNTGIPYNAVHWDGSKWELKRIQTYFRGSLVTVPLEGIMAYSSTDIWIGGGGLPIHGDGNTWTMYDLRTTLDPYISLSKAWGKSTNDICFVGMGGSIAHYQNGIWNKIESGTTTSLNDIWGYYNSETNCSTILTVASDLMDVSEHRLLAISGNGAKDTLDYPYNKRLKNVWFKNNYSPIYVSGTDVMKYERGKWQVFDLSNWEIRAMRGREVNDIVVVDAEGKFFHFNGVEWTKDESLVGQYGFESIAIKNNTVVIVGTVLNGVISSEAVVIVGKR
jgi:hypothetical protein